MVKFIRAIGVILLMYASAIILSSIYIWPDDFLTNFESRLIPTLFTDYPWINATIFLFISLLLGFHAMLVNLINPLSDSDYKRQLYFVKGVDYIWYGLGALGVVLIVLDLQVRSYANKADEIDGMLLGIRSPQYTFIEDLQHTCNVISRDDLTPSHPFLGKSEIDNAKRLCAGYENPGFDLSDRACDTDIKEFEYEWLWVNEGVGTPNREYLLATIYCSSTRLEKEGLSKISELEEKYSDIDDNPFSKGFLFFIFPLIGIALRLVKTTIEMHAAIRS